VISLGWRARRSDSDVPRRSNAPGRYTGDQFFCKQGEPWTTPPKQRRTPEKRRGSSTFSSTPLSWLNEQGQPLSLREIFDVYLWRGFCMKQSEHVLIESVVPNMSAAYAAEQLQRVRDVAARTCSTLAGLPVGPAVFEA